MKTPFILPAFIGLLAVIGCQKPCTKTTHQIAFAGDTIFTIRTYPNCADTLTYHQRQVKADSGLVSVGKIANGRKVGEWTYNGYTKSVTRYEAGVEVEVKDYDKQGRLRLERTLGKDSLYTEKQFYRNGKVGSQRFINMQGYLTGHGIEFDSLGRKMAEGNHIAEDVLPDTAFIPSPEPPHDMQQTIITESGGKHGPWLFYDPDGSINDTVTYDRGVAVWSGDLVGRWRIDSISTTDTSSMGMMAVVIGMAFSDLQGFEFTNNYEMIHFDSKGKKLAVGSYGLSRDRAMLFMLNNDEEDQAWIRGLTPTRLKLLSDDIVIYLLREPN
jgi:antitoxin component YwqK of YwqJK toxin-antitoxin module